MALIGSGSKLYTMQLWPPGHMSYPLPKYTNGREPATPPPFLLDEIPEELDDTLIPLGGSATIWDYLEEAGIEELQWRQPLKHLEGQYWSEDVYTTMKEILGDQLTSTRTFMFSHYPSDASRYYEHRIGPWPIHRLVGEPPPYRIPSVPWVVTEMCVPPLGPEAGFGPDLRSAVNALKGQDVTLAIPKWIDQGPEKVLQLNSRHIVTEEFVERWQSTDISKHLREENWENDIGFVPTNFGFHRDHQVNYKWVDAPMPEDVQP